MSIGAVTQPNIYKKQKPGVKLSSGSTASNNLKAVLSDLKETKQTTGTSNTSGTVSATPIKAKSTMAKQVSSNISSSTSESVFRESYKGGKYIGTTPYTEGMRFVSPSDYKRENVRTVIPGEISGYVGLTSRGQNRAMKPVNDFLNWQQQQYQKMMERAKCMDTAQMFNNISQGILGVGNIATGIIQAKQSTKVETPTDATVNELRQADNSAELKAGISELNAQQQTLTTKIDNANKSIKESQELRADAESKLQTTEDNISSTKKSIAEYSSNITKWQSSLQSEEATLKQLESMKMDPTSLSYAGVQNQIKELKTNIKNTKQKINDAEKAKQEAMTKLKEFESARLEYTQTIQTASNDIKTNSQSLEALNDQQEDVTDALGKYNQTLTKMENKESDKLNSMRSQLAEYAKEYQTETDPGKKEKLQQKYAKQAAEYNQMVGSTTVSGHTAVGTQLG